MHEILFNVKIFIRNFELKVLPNLSSVNVLGSRKKEKVANKMGVVDGGGLYVF